MLLRGSAARSAYTGELEPLYPCTIIWYGRICWEGRPRRQQLFLESRPPHARTHARTQQTLTHTLATSSIESGRGASKVLRCCRTTGNFQIHRNCVSSWTSGTYAGKCATMETNPTCGSSNIGIAIPVRRYGVRRALHSGVIGLHLTALLTECYHRVARPFPLGSDRIRLPPSRSSATHARARRAREREGEGEGGREGEGERDGEREG